MLAALYIIMLILLVVVMLVEYFMSTEWNPAYFKLGIPIYSKRLINKASILSSLDKNDLNSISKSFVLMLTTPLVFKKIAEGQWAFRQQSFRNTIMHGTLFIEPETSDIRLVGFINWSFLLLLCEIVIISFLDVSLFIIIAIPTATMLCYFLEKHMYDKLVNYLSQVP
jgi:hypothetical protein